MLVTKGPCQVYQSVQILRIFVELDQVERPRIACRQLLSPILVCKLADTDTLGSGAVDSEHKAKVLRPWTATRPHHLSFHLNWCAGLSLTLETVVCCVSLFGQLPVLASSQLHACESVCFHQADSCSAWLVGCASL